jgi:hypothetical protein
MSFPRKPQIIGLRKGIYESAALEEECFRMDDMLPPGADVGGIGLAS